LWLATDRTNNCSSLSLADEIIVTRSRSALFSLATAHSHFRFQV